MLGRLIKDSLLLTAGAAIGAAGAMWLMSEAGKPMRGELVELAKQAKEKFRECQEKLKEEMEAQHE